ncbi:hypothetical protein BX666DRAFT_806866 [Dichotomocladium elegans]|nr:hypothetical protein BX666DRAFT_806866 [Dichotomocladium elegans]
MNWYLQHGGKSPEPIHKEILAKQANKSLVQVSTWFQNARRRHHHKLIQYQRLSKQFPTKALLPRNDPGMMLQKLMMRLDLHHLNESEQTLHLPPFPHHPSVKSLLIIVTVF